jgi:hypothetical protein
MKLEEVGDMNRNREKQGFSSLQGSLWAGPSPLEADQCWPSQVHAIVRTRMLLDAVPRNEPFASPTTGKGLPGAE